MLQSLLSTRVRQQMLLLLLLLAWLLFTTECSKQLMAVLLC
jgi:hypothetical protein